MNLFTNLGHWLHHIMNKSIKEWKNGSLFGLDQTTLDTSSMVTKRGEIISAFALESGWTSYLVTSNGNIKYSASIESPSHWHHRLSLETQRGLRAFYRPALVLVQQRLCKMGEQYPLLPDCWPENQTKKQINLGFAMEIIGFHGKIWKKK